MKKLSKNAINTFVKNHKNHKPPAGTGCFSYGQWESPYITENGTCGLYTRTYNGGDWEIPEDACKETTSALWEELLDVWRWQEMNSNAALARHLYKKFGK